MTEVIEARKIGKNKSNVALPRLVDSTNNKKVEEIVSWYATTPRSLYIHFLFFTTTYYTT
jgi:hypothetical protein